MFDISELNRLSTDIMQIATKELNLKEGANKLADNVRKLAPSPASVKRYVGENEIGVQTQDPITVYMELGTGPVGIAHPYPVADVESQIGTRHTISRLAPDAGISRIDRPWHYYNAKTGEGAWTAGIQGKAFMHRGVTEIQSEVVGEMVDELFK